MSGCRIRRSVPGCRVCFGQALGYVPISVIVPDFVSKRLADLIALGPTMAAASRLKILLTVVIGVASAGILRHLRFGTRMTPKLAFKRRKVTFHARILT